jgi:hypothetical protein
MWVVVRLPTQLSLSTSCRASDDGDSDESFRDINEHEGVRQA